MNSPLTQRKGPKTTAESDGDPPTLGDEITPIEEWAVCIYYAVCVSIEFVNRNAPHSGEH